MQSHPLNGLQHIPKEKLVRYWFRSKWALIWWFFEQRILKTTKKNCYYCLASLSMPVWFHCFMLKHLSWTPQIEFHSHVLTTMIELALNMFFYEKTENKTICNLAAQLSIVHGWILMLRCLWCGADKWESGHTFWMSIET